MVEKDGGRQMRELLSSSVVFCGLLWFSVFISPVRITRLPIVLIVHRLRAEPLQLQRMLIQHLTFG